MRETDVDAFKRIVSKFGMSEQDAETAVCKNWQIDEIFDGKEM